VFKKKTGLSDTLDPARSIGEVLEERVGAPELPLLCRGPWELSLSSPSNLPPGPSPGPGKTPFLASSPTQYSLLQELWPPRMSILQMRKLAQRGAVLVQGDRWWEVAAQILNPMVLAMVTLPSPR
jgi:hypothetical protein